MRSGILLSLGIALITLSLLSINVPITSTVSVTKPYTLYVPPTAHVYAIIYENDSNVTLYVRILHDNSFITKPPITITLTPGYWEFSIYNETYPITLSKEVNVTVNTSRGIFIYEKVIHYSEIVTTKNATFPFFIKIVIYKVDIIRYRQIGLGLGIALILGDFSLFFLSRRNKI
ncbi:hypothetical protein [Saccharolobus caldissimus]|uniref:Uncharacterized protein n=1 Tax=Saccharolobus caldissimus TaxID=1702097 RepID=A0AAQ4CSA8_9CREN|nr:hypothetical protein [Saccharolobus caldissimus]BDB98689.1 hypothetical protein SACC_17060 [Saccharolobus caldissimus]